MIESLARKLYKEKYKKTKLLLDHSKISNFAHHFIDLLFPQRNAKRARSEEELTAHLYTLKSQLCSIFASLNLKDESYNIDGPGVCDAIFSKLSKIEDQLNHDAKSIYEGDPAAESIDEVIVSYPGFFAIAIYRVANAFYHLKVPIFPRVLCEYAHEKTGIDIHPGATIGNNFFIDHGTGLVIGETTVIGNNVKIYQGVTLGALSVDKSQEHSKRHPTIEDRSIIYSGATILGGDTIVGKHSIIGGNVWLTKSVPEYSLVYHKSEIKLHSQKKS